MAEIKPCPFTELVVEICQEAEDLHQDGNEQAAIDSWSFAERLEKAIAAWNQRTEPVVEPVAQLRKNNIGAITFWEYEEACDLAPGAHDLYTHPPKPSEVGEVGWREKFFQADCALSDLDGVVESAIQTIEDIPEGSETRDELDNWLTEIRDRLQDGRKGVKKYLAGDAKGDKYGYFGPELRERYTDIDSRIKAIEPTPTGGTEDE